MSVDAGKDIRDMLALQATVKDLAARLAMAESRLDALENPESRNAHALAEMAASLPSYAEHLTQAEVKAKRESE